MKDYRDQQPRASAFFRSDVNGAVESMNCHALENAGKSNERYIAFLEAVIEELESYVDDAKREEAK